MARFRDNQDSQKTLWGVLMIAVGISIMVGCTKQIPYDSEYKDKVYSNSLLDTRGEYLFTASMANASSDDANARPYWFGETKRVKLNMTEKALRIEETVMDQRFEANDGNKKVVLEIPVEHHAYECAKDRFGECTNKEQENKELDWNLKTEFTMDLAAAKSAQLEILPILLQKDVTNGFCYSQVSARTISQDVTAEAINFEIERNFKNLCTAARDLSGTNVRAVFHYSLVKVNAVATPGFIAREYPKEDERTFGYFYTERYKRDLDKNETESGRLALQNHWDPNRQFVDYYLSDEFNKPENKMLKDLSYVSFDRVNRGLEQAGAKIRLRLNEPAGKVPGDIRNSMIVLVEDPYAAGPLGYGPQTEDPVTGEIVSARVVMYSGVFESIIKVYYEDLLRANAGSNAIGAMNKMAQDSTLVRKSRRATPALMDALKKNFTQKKSEGEPSADEQTAARSTVEGLKQLKTLDFSKRNAKSVAARSFEGAGDFLSSEKILKASQTLLEDKSFQYLTMLNRMENGEMDNTELTAEGLKATQSHEDVDIFEKKLTYLRDVKNCAYVPQMSSAATSVNYVKLATVLAEKHGIKTPKAWENMTRAEKRTVMNFFMSEMWVSTLIHELGHNLGLRHNFKGSEDKMNFPTKAELAAIGDDREPLSSSVMDYVDDNVALKHMGQYDVAAFRYAYANEIELVQYRKELKAGGETDKDQVCSDVTDAEGRKPLARLVKVKTSQTVKTLKAVLQLVSSENVKNSCAYKKPDLGKLQALQARCKELNPESLRGSEAEPQDVATSKLCQALEDMKAAGLMNASSWQGLQLKSYGFCTDESVGINPGCRRFDLGTTYTAMAQNLIDTYEDRYWSRNLRRDRVSFSLFDDPSYYRRIMASFLDMRLMLEGVERFKGLGLAYDNPTWQKNAMFKDMRGAAVLVGEKLLDIVTSPTKYCFVAKVDGTGGVNVSSLETMGDGDGVDCWEIEGNLKAEYAIIGQTGKNFNAAKSMTSENSYADQIDVRGMWMDKRAAMHMLLRRVVGISTLDAAGENFLDLPELREKINEAFIAVITNKVKKDVTVELADGTLQQIPFAYDVFEHNVIKKPIHPYIAARLGFDDKMYFSTMLMHAVPYWMTNFIGKSDSERSFAKQYLVSSYNLLQTNASPDGLQGKIFVDIGNVRYVAGPENVVAADLIQSVKAKYGMFNALAQSLSIMDAAKFSEEDGAKIEAVKKALREQLPKLKDQSKLQELVAQIVQKLLVEVKVDAAVKAEDIQQALGLYLIMDPALMQKMAASSSLEDLVTNDFEVKLLRLMPTSNQ